MPEYSTPPVPSVDAEQKTPKLEQKHFELIKILRALAQTEWFSLGTKTNLALNEQAYALAKASGLEIQYFRLARYDAKKQVIIEGHEAQQEVTQQKLGTEIGRGCWLEFTDFQQNINFVIFDFDNLKDFTFIKENQQAILQTLSKEGNRMNYQHPAQPIILVAGEPLL